ncbi:transmembrane protein 242 isoform X2 [Prionailurus viverrinus]|uniref:transmembrane protein 242 isoform X2 n=1 Tax=Prionailurus viverrinus TaxID=61388 RepID=UPI001FF1F150|nr:transmembrane protein 242 isoform X2 [Prionailurus viverrinus]
MEAAGAGAGQPSSRLEAPESTDDRLFLIKGKYGHGCLTGERVYPCLASLGLGLTLCVVWGWCDQLRSLESFRSTQWEPSSTGGFVPQIALILRHRHRNPGFHDFYGKMKDFRSKMQSIFPAIPKNSESTLEWEEALKSK